MFIRPEDNDFYYTNGNLIDDVKNVLPESEYLNRESLGMMNGLRCSSSTYQWIYLSYTKNHENSLLPLQWLAIYPSQGYQGAMNINIQNSTSPSSTALIIYITPGVNANPPITTMILRGAQSNSLSGITGNTNFILMMWCPINPD